MKYCYVFVFLILSFFQSGAQLKDSSIVIPMMTLNTGFDIPGYDMADRFGSNLKVGSSFLIKTKNYWLFGFDAMYLFSDRVREDGVLDSISTPGGQIINQNGIFSDYVFQERGFYLGPKVGKMIPVLGPNPNSGFIVTFSAGFLQHQIFIADAHGNTPQIEKKYTKGYDRLSNGLALQEFLGYMYINNKATMSFYAGFESTQGFTRSRRDWDFDLMRQDTKKRFDLLYGLKIGWIITFHKRMATGYYIY